MSPSLLADIVLFLHLIYAASVLSGYFLILLGHLFNWSFIRSRRLRLIHIGMIVFVGIEALIGMVCPLTSLEAYLRTGSGDAERSFMSRLMENLLFYDFPEAYFTYAYVFLSGFAILLYFLVPSSSKKEL